MVRNLKIISLLVVLFIIYQAACRMDDVEIPEPTGISGAKIFMTIVTNPDIVVSDGVSSTSISIRVSDYLLNPRGNVLIFLETLNKDKEKYDIGKFTNNRVVSGGDGMAYTTWISPNLKVDTTVFIQATAYDAEFAYQVTATTIVHLVKPNNYPDVPPTGVCGQEGYPSLFMNFQPANPSPGNTVTFSAAGSYDSDGYIVSYLWNFGDGTKRKGITTKHVYKMEGNYLIILTGTDNDGKSCSITGSINVGSVFGCAISTSSGGPGGVSNISITSSNGVPNYKWHIDLGDGTIYNFTTSAESMSLDHIYTSPGPFDVYVRITDGQGKVAVCTGIVL